MKTMNNTLKYWALALIVIVAASVVNCNKDEAPGPPEIHGVRITDPATADSLFTQALPGQMIVIVGKNLQNAKKVFINNQDLFFNANYNTATHIIVNIPSEEDGFETVYINPDLPTEIRVETDKGIARYNFLVTYPYPSITLITADTYPTPANSKMTVTGYNFVDIKKVYFTEVLPELNGQQFEVQNYEVLNNRYLDPVRGYVTESTLSFRLPANLPRTDGNFFGFLVVECVAQTAYSTYFTLPAPIIQSISSDMPLPGMKVTINGLYFIDVESIQIGDDITIMPEDMEVATREKIVFTMPGKPSKSGLKITAFNGEATIDNFYPYEQLLTDFDEIGNYESWSGDDVTFMNADETPGEPPYFSDGKYGRIKGIYGGTWWAGAVAMFKDDDQVENIMPSFDYIPADTPASDVYLAYECYNRFSFAGAPAFIRYEFLIDGSGEFNYFNYDWGTNTTRDVSHPGYDGIPIYDEWYTVMVPLSRFSGLEDATYSDIVEQNITMLHFVVINPNGPNHEIDIFFDNIRFIIKPQ